jgi:membrane protein
MTTMSEVFSPGGWKLAGRLVIQSAKDFANDNCPQWAAAIAYYGLLSLFPLLLAATAIAANFVDPQWAIQQGSSLMKGFLPGSADYIRQIVEGIIQTRGRIGFFSLLLLIWSGSRVFGVVTKALNIAYDIDDLYGFFKRTLVELLMTFTIGVLLMLAIGSRLVIGFIGGLVRLPFIPQSVLYRILGYAVPAMLLLISMFLIYEYVPRRRVNGWASLVGSVLFTTLFLGAQPIFSGYIRKFANYNLIYGPLAIVVVLVLWAWITSNFLLFGGEVVSHIQAMLVDKKSAEEVETSHKRRDPTRRGHS